MGAMAVMVGFTSCSEDDAPARSATELLADIDVSTAGTAEWTTWQNGKSFTNAEKENLAAYWDTNRSLLTQEGQTFWIALMETWNLGGDDPTEGTDPTTPGGNTDATTFVNNYLGGSAYAQVDGSTITLKQDVTLSSSGNLKDGLTLVIPAGKKLINNDQQLNVQGSAKVVVKGTGSIELGVIPSLGGGYSSGSLYFYHESKLILEQGGTVKLLKAEGYSTVGVLGVKIDAGIYGGTADAPNIGKTKLSGERLTNGAGTDKLKVVVGGNTTNKAYYVTVVPNTEPTINSLYLVMGKTQYSVGQDCNASSGVDADSNEAGTSFETCYLSVGDDFSTYLGNNDNYNFDRSAITLTGL
ncbi:hypothetical protein AGMMS49982_00490 [Bacteroidia bacterium]|nr:hypothetical protein AGMMS49982_00490 [Bacteroidia bacterium]